MSSSNKALAPSQVETRSVDFVPHAERFGKSRDLGNVWFVGNVNLTAMATGVVALSLGGNLIWTVIAVVLGSLFGTFFMAFHSAQGPQLGLPQLVQSRAQFGYIGAALTVWIFALANYIAYNTSDAILSGSAMHEIFKIPADAPSKDAGTTPIPTTGPYMFASYDPNKELKMVRNPNFKEWNREAQPAGYPDEIVYQFGLTAEAQVNAVKNAQADWMYDPIPADRQRT